MKGGLDKDPFFHSQVKGGGIKCLCIITEAGGWVGVAVY
jgi:hypothetical protein